MYLYNNLLKAKPSKGTEYENMTAKQNKILNYSLYNGGTWN